jgi:hypothetical protein
MWSIDHSSSKIFSMTYCNFETMSMLVTPFKEKIENHELENLEVPPRAIKKSIHFAWKLLDQ